MCQAHTGAYVSLLAAGEIDYTACHPARTTTYILHVLPITTHTHVRRKSIGKKNKENKRRERKGKKREESEKGKEIKEKTRQARKNKTRRRIKERKREKKCHTSRP